jgi:phosphatidylserine/phosphatidylglycerophosphate/cardiolipin synthase-like enzyme
VHLLRGALALALSGALVVSAGPTSLAAGSAPASASPVLALADTGKDKPKKPPYVVRPGVTFNSALGSRAAKRKIYDKLLGAINHARPGSQIKIMSWNFMSAEATTALLRAQRRGAIVHLLIDASNNDEDTPNPPFQRLQRELERQNGHKRPERRSEAKMCAGSCRSSGGAAHAKYFLFSRTGKSRHVFMQGSANLTVAAAFNQWNDLFTFVDKPKLYAFAEGVFEQAWQDQPVKEPYVSFRAGRFGIYFSPYKGSKFVSDPVQDAMDQIRCKGAVQSGNARHRTIVRSAPDVIRGKRGMVAAKRLKKLWDQGCDVRLVYTVMGVDVRRVLRSPSGRGPVPMRHLVQDFDGDGDFDNYFHMKVLTINGVLGKDKTTYLMFNGSSNTSDLATWSDENIGSIRGKGYTVKYQEHIDYWFEHAPKDGCEGQRERLGLCGTSAGGAGGGGAARTWVADPYVNVDLD